MQLRNIMPVRWIISRLSDPQASPVVARLLRGAFWSVCGMVISRGLGLIAGVFVARVLGKSDFGQLGMIQSTLGMFGVVAGFGMGLTATKHVAEFKVSAPQRAGRIISLSSLVSWLSGGLMTVVLWVFAPWLAREALNSSDMVELLRAGSLLLLFGGINGAQTGALAGFEAFRAIARINLLTGLSSFPLTLLGTWLLGVMGAVWALVASLLVNCLLNYLELRREMHRAGVEVDFRELATEWPVLWRFSLPALCSGMIYSPAMWICSAILIKQPDGYGQLGIFNAVIRIKQLPEAVLTVALAPLLPALADHFARKEIPQYNKALSIAFATSAVIIIPAALIQTGWPALSLRPFGPDFAGNDAVVRAVMLQAVLVGLSFPFSSVFASMNRMWFGFGYNLSYGLLAVVLCLWWVPLFGVLGLAFAITVTHALTALVCVAYIYRYEKPFIAEIPIISYSLLILALYVVCVATGIWFGVKAGFLAGVTTAGLSLFFLKTRFKTGLKISAE